MLPSYAPVSTADQKLDLQIDALRQAGRKKVYTDVARGARAERPGLGEALCYAPADETLGRSLATLYRYLPARDLAVAATAPAPARRRKHGA